MTIANSRAICSFLHPFFVRYDRLQTDRFRGNINHIFYIFLFVFSATWLSRARMCSRQSCSSVRVAPATRAGDTVCWASFRRGGLPTTLLFFSRCYVSVPFGIMSVLGLGPDFDCDRGQAPITHCSYCDMSRMPFLRFLFFSLLVGHARRAIRYPFCKRCLDWIRLRGPSGPFGGALPPSNLFIPLLGLLPKGGGPPRAGEGLLL